MADPDASLTPEQRLLKLIEEGGGADAQQSAAEGAVPSGKTAKPAREQIDWKAVLSPAALRARFEYLRDQSIELFKQNQRKLGLKEVNRILVTASAILGGIVIVNGLYEVHLISRDFLEQFDVSQKRMADVLAPGNQDLGGALEEDNSRRNIFAPYSEQTVVAEQKSSDIALKLMEITKTLKLTGISYFEGDASRTFCMIEDIQKNITTFLRQGESLGGVTVKEIRQDNVVLKLGEEEMEIR